MKTNFVGIHLVDVPTVDSTQGLVWNWVVQVLYNPILAMVKTSVLIFLLRIGGQKPGVTVAIHALNAFNIALMIAIFIVVIFQCNPIAYNWDSQLDGTCVQQGEFYLVTAALTIFTDVLVLALPFWIFLDLKMPRKQKLALIFVFFLGFIVTIVGVARLVFIYQGFFQAAGNDPTYSIAFTISAIETNLAIITASAPALRPLIRSWWPKIFSTSGNTYPSGDRYAYGGPGHVSQYGTGYASASRGTSHHHKKAGGSVVGPSFAMKDLKGRTEIRSHSPHGSEEEIMTYNGIMRTTNVTVQYGAGSHDAESSDGTRTVGDRDRDRDRDMKGDMGLRTSISGSL
ncbi:hypothetical protein MKZ38_000832 [Zalerion maritima]|uniref:Rhodopsin domain-containing protein n=1 Tax=Zalerion maritima TaxID=339359 RepID=A0AAD5RS38_9PEZI|nr:hypothetical protein MKZ38_000832 [Zalerion maritima]